MRDLWWRVWLVHDVSENDTVSWRCGQNSRRDIKKVSKGMGKELNRAKIGMGKQNCAGFERADLEDDRGRCAEKSTAWARRADE